MLRRPLTATFVVRTSASHLAITDRIDTPYNTNGRSMHPDLHGSDEAKQDAQLKRIERRAKKGDAAK